MGSTTDAGSGFPPFVACGSCRSSWRGWEDFLLDRSIRLLGMQAYARVPDANLLIFEHNCGTSISVLTARLRHLLDELDDEPKLPTLFGTDSCSGHCRFIGDLSACDQPCANARDRRLAVLVHEIKQTGHLPMRPSP